MLIFWGGGGCRPLVLLIKETSQCQIATMLLAESPIIYTTLGILYYLQAFIIFLRGFTSNPHAKQDKLKGNLVLSFCVLQLIGIAVIGQRLFGLSL